jgi:hypothetical protein
MWEAQANEPCRGMVLVSPAVVSLLRGRSVVPQPVRLYDEAEIGPVEIDAVPVHSRLRLG